MKNILIVDDETPFLLSLKVGLSSILPQYGLYTAGNGEEALDLLADTQFDLLLTDLKMPVMDGFGLLAHMLSKHIYVPTIVMTAFNTTEVEERLKVIGSFQLLEKPLDFKSVADKIKEVLREGAKGSIQGISLASFLQLVGMDQKTCTLMVKSGKKNGMLYFKKGEIVHAATGENVGKEAAYEIVSWSNPEIDVIGVCTVKTKTIDEPITSILFNSSRLQDERLRGEIETGDVGNRKVETKKVETKQDTSVQKSSGKATPVRKQSNKEEHIMSVEEKLKEFESIDGFMGVGVFTPDGEVLGLKATTKANLKEVGVLANGVLMNAQKASLEMNAGKGQLVHIEAEKNHIIVRCLNEGTDPLKSQPGKAHIHLVLVLGPDASMGLAKLKIEKLTPGLADEFRS